MTNYKSIFGIIFLILISIRIASANDVKESKANCLDGLIGLPRIKALLSPYEALKKGPVTFEGHESVSGGRGGGIRLVRFTIALKPKHLTQWCQVKSSF